MAGKPRRFVFGCDVFKGIESLALGSQRIRASQRFRPGRCHPMTGAPSQPANRRVLLALAIVLGVGAGVGSYTFRYAEGLSYFSTDPKACINCHIMEPQFASWQKSSHHTAAVCVDCHLPESFIPKYIAKAENGWRHGKLFTTQNFEEPIRIQKRGAEILQENCVRCHASMVEGMLTAAPTRPGEVALDSHQLPAGSSARCVHCHLGAGHGPRAALGGPPRRDEFTMPEPSPEP